MTPERFRKICKARLRECLMILDAKREEYSLDSSRLANFHWSANFLGVSAPFACMAIASKHFTSIMLDVKKLERGEAVNVKKLRKRKITDAINYLLFLEGILQEREEEVWERRL